MSDVGKITIIAKNIKGNANGQVRYDAKKISNTSGGVFTQNGKGNGISYRNSEKRKAQVKTTTVTYKVKEIELITALDGGSLNDKSGGTQKGMVFGKTYEFKVKSYVDKEPQNKSVINWMFKYHNLSKNKWEEINLKAKGEVMKLFVNEKEMCGRYVYVRAYINDPKTEGEIKVWKHNRFRWFDRMVVHEQAEARAKEPWRINQESSSLCGMASLYNVLIKKDHSTYLKIAKELFRTGEVTINNFNIKPHEKAYIMYDMNPKSSDYKTVRMPEIDWIVLATTRSREAFLFNKLVYKGVEKGDIDMITAVNWPEMMQQMTKSIASFSKVEIFGLNKFLIQQKKRPLGGRLYDHFSDSDLEHLLDIDKKFKKGHHILMMIDSNMIEDIASYSYNDIFRNSHWVVYEGGLAFYNANHQITNTLDHVEHVSFKIYTWGYNSNNNYKDEKGNLPFNLKLKLLFSPNKISAKTFKSTFYGYIEAY